MAQSVCVLHFFLADQLSIPGTGMRLRSAASIPAVGYSQLPILWVPGIKRPEREADHFCYWVCVGLCVCARAYEFAAVNITGRCVRNIAERHL
jgi:hypothetical protein